MFHEGYMIYECNSSCCCWEDCENCILQNSVRVKLEVFKSQHKVLHLDTPLFCFLLAKLVPSAQQFFYRWECSMVLDLGTSGLGVTSWRIDITWNICMWVHWRSTEWSGGEQKGWEVIILSLPSPDALGKTTPLFTYLNQKSHSIQQQTV